MAAPTMTSAVATLDPAHRQRSRSDSTATHEAKKIFSKIQSVWTRVPSTTLRLETNSTSPFRSSRTTAWLDPLASIGSNIDTGTKKMNALKAWFTKGPAQDTFEKKILPELEHLLENCGLPEGAPLFLRDYMIGLSESRAVPTVMICCIDKNILATAKRCVSESGVVKSHGFKLGCSALCLEAKTMPIRCMEEPYTDEESDESLHDPKTGSIVLGGRVFFQSHDNGNLRAATAGPVVMLGGAVYQLTVAHVLIKEDEPSIDQEERDLDEFELESDHDEYGLEQYCGITSKGSISSGDHLDENDLDEKGKSSESSDTRYSQDDMYQLRPYRRWCFRRPEEQILDRSCDELHPPANVFCPSRHIEAGEVSSSPKPNHTLDYLLFDIPHEDKLLSSSIRRMNTVHPKMYKKGNKSGTGHPMLEIRQTAAIGSSERDVILLTSVGVVSGRLIPGATSYRQSSKTTFQKVHIVLTEFQVSKGDCGTAVIDASTGNFYGHIVLGVPGTFLAYIVPSLEVLQDIQNQTGLEASLDVSQFQDRAEHEPPQDKIFGDESHNHLVERPLFSQEQHERSEPQMGCPFYRLNPSRHWRCRNLRLRRFVDVKIHLIRMHSSSDYYCDHCQTDLRMLENWSEHLRKGCGNKPTAADKSLIAREKFELINEIPVRKSGAEKYSIMWNILFPGEDLYPAPVYRQTLDSPLPSTPLPLESSDFSSNEWPEQNSAEQKAPRSLQQTLIQP